MSEDRNADGASATGDSTNSVNRRRFVKTLGAAGGATVFGSMGVSSASAKDAGESDDKPKLDIQSETGEVETTIKQRAFSNSKFRKIRQEFISKGWEPGTGEVLKTIGENGDVQQYTFSLSFDSGTATVFWTDNPEDEPFGLYGENRGEEVTLVRFAVEDEEVVSASDTFTKEDFQKSVKKHQTSTAGEISPAFTPPDAFPFCTWNSSCIGKIAAAAGGTVGCCGTCSSLIGAAASAFTACACCLGAGIGFVSIECNVCE